jgi:hypothetical protein
LPKSQGSYLISFLTLVVTFAGTHLWKLICFAVHQAQSSQTATDGLHQQTQSILVTDMTNVGMLLQFGKMVWAWRGKTTRVWSRGMLLFTACILHFAAITVAGLMTSRVADSADHVLIQATGDCGWYNEVLLSQLNLGSNFTNEDLNAFDSLALATHLGISEAQQYAKTCYSWLDGYQPDNSSAACSRYVVPSLSSTINGSADCPFAPEACSTPAIALDSGWIDSNDHLGINAPAEDRLKLRLALTCAPIPLEQRYSRGWEESPLFPGELVKIYRLGESLYFNSNGSNITSYILANQSLTSDGPSAPA